jgi:hypothetical protein
MARREQIEHDKTQPQCWIGRENATLGHTFDQGRKADSGRGRFSEETLVGLEDPGSANGPGCFFRVDPRMASSNVQPAPESER